MDTKKCGSFIASLRKERVLTQAQLAAAIGVTDKAVSRWETGKGFPDVDSLVKLSEFFDVTVNELLLGEYGSKASGDQALLQMYELREHENRFFKRLLVILAVTAVLIAVLVGVAVDRFLTGFNRTEVYPPQTLMQDLVTAENVEVCVDDRCVADDIGFLFVSKLRMSEWVLTEHMREDGDHPVAVITAKGDDRITVYLYERYATASLLDYANERFEGTYTYPDELVLDKDLLM